MDQAFDHIRNSVDVANAKLIEVVAIALVPVFAFVRAAVFRKKLDDLASIVRANELAKADHFRRCDRNHRRHFAHDESQHIVLCRLTEHGLYLNGFDLTNAMHWVTDHIAYFKHRQRSFRRK